MKLSCRAGGWGMERARFKRGRWARLAAAADSSAALLWAAGEPAEGRLKKRVRREFFFSGKNGSRWGIFI